MRGRREEKALAVRSCFLLACRPVICRVLQKTSAGRVRRSAAFWLTLCAMFLPAAVLAAEEAYTVKRGDTLFGVARRYGLSPSVLAERNGLSRNNYLYTGQRLIIPAKPAARKSSSKPGPAPAKAASVRLPSNLQRAIDRAPVRVGRWRYIIIHHSGVDTGTVKSMDRYHRDVRRMQNGIAYHFVVGNGKGMGDGEISTTRRWTWQLDGGHLASLAQDKVALGICLVGNFDRNPPSARQMESLRLLTEALLVRCRLTPAAVKTHQQINVLHTRCPGTKFPTSKFIRSLKPPPARK